MQHDVQCVAFSSSPSPRSFPFSLSPDSHWSSCLSRISRAALVAARHACRRPRAVRRCGLLSIRTHHDLCHHVVCLFDTWFFSCIEFVPPPFSSTLPSRVVSSPSSSCPPWASTLLSCPPWASTLSLLYSLLLWSLRFSRLPFLLLLSFGLSRQSFSLFLSLHLFLSLFLNLRLPLLLLLSLSLF